MRRSDFHYHLPPERIAHHPQDQRSASRLLRLRPDGACTDGQFTDLLEWIRPEDLLVFNDTRVIPARLHGHKASGGKVEVLVERVLDAHRVLAHVRASKAPKAGTELILEAGLRAQVEGREEDLFRLHFGGEASVLELLDAHGHMPLPPYIDRADAPQDRERYQTVYAREPGAVAAPTAGLHFDQALLDALRAKGVEFGYVTLHVGAGTFQPVRAEQLNEHRMHSEFVAVGPPVCEQIGATRARGGRVIAVGTTVVRSLESAARTGDASAVSRRDGYLYYTGL